MGTGNLMDARITVLATSSRAILLSRFPTGPWSPVSSNDSDDLGQRVQIAHIDHFSRRMRVAQRPAYGHVSRPVEQECGSIIAAAGDAILLGDPIGAGHGNDSIS